MEIQLIKHQPLVKVLIEATDDRIQWVKLVYHETGFAYQIQGNPTQNLTHQIIEFLKNYSSKCPSPPPSLNWDSVPLFTKNVLHTLATIPFSRTLTYKQVAQKIDSPRAFRAIGRACGKNPFPLFIPCHRVVSIKSLGGFSQEDGLKMKKILLDFEES